MFKVLRRLVIIFTVLWCVLNLPIYLAVPLFIITEWYFEFGNEMAEQKIKEHSLTKERRQAIAKDYRESMDRAIKQQKLDRIIETPEYLAKYMPRVS